MTTQLYLHTDKTVICLQGDNPADFLNDLLTAQIEQLEEGIARAAACSARKGASCLICWFYAQQRRCIW